MKLFRKIQLQCYANYSSQVFIESGPVF